MEWLREFVQEYLTFTGKCFRHCERPTNMNMIIQDGGSVVGAYVCPSGFVSQVVYFSPKPDLEWFRDMLSKQVGSENVSARDVRVASRHGWELGDGAQKILESKLEQGGSIKEVYWTRYPRTEDQKKQAVSLCTGSSSRAGCMKLFIHDRNVEEPLCPACRAAQGTTPRL